MIGRWLAWKLPERSRSSSIWQRSELRARSRRDRLDGPPQHRHRHRHTLEGFLADSAGGRLSVENIDIDQAFVHHAGISSAQAATRPVRRSAPRSSLLAPAPRSARSRLSPSAYPHPTRFSPRASPDTGGGPLFNRRKQARLARLRFPLGLIRAAPATWSDCPDPWRSERLKSPPHAIPQRTRRVTLGRRCRIPAKRHGQHRGRR